MQVWSTEIKELETLFTSIKGHVPELDKELSRLINADDENMVLLYSRRCLEVIITELCESELQRPRKTEPLKGIIDKLHKEEKVPSHIITSMHGLNDLSTYGTHPKEYYPEQVKPVLNNLATIIKWYVKYKDTQIISKAKPEELKYESKESVNVIESYHNPKKRLILLLSGIALVVAIIVVALFIFNIVGGGKQTEELEKSIAVLPFKNDSPDQERMYFINGTMEAILDNLCKIEDLRVPGRTSVEQYRDKPKPIPAIAKELNVSYILEGSGHRDGNNVRLFVQLLDGKKDKHLWSKTYNATIEDIFFMQSEIAQLIANELKVIITPEEKRLIEKSPTTSLTAYDFYQRGREEHWKYTLNSENRESLERAEDLYNKALEYDSTFAQAYTGLAGVYWDKHYWESYLSENFQDSVMILTDIALSYDDQLSEAYMFIGKYYGAVGRSEQASEYFEKAIKFNPNNWQAYYELGMLYLAIDPIKVIDNFQKAASVNRGPELPSVFKMIGLGYMFAGFNEKAEAYFLEALKLDGDSSQYYFNLGWLQTWLGNNENAHDFFLKAYEIDSSGINIFRDLDLLIGINLSYLGQYTEALKYLKKLENRNVNIQSLIYFNNLHRIGYVYWQNGFKEEAENYLNKQMEYYNKSVELGRGWSEQYWLHYDIAMIYAFRGEKKKAYENLRIFSQEQKIPQYLVTQIKNDPFFESIRDEPEFQQIIRDVEAKYQAEHEKVRKWLEEQGML